MSAGGKHGWRGSHSRLWPPGDDSASHATRHLKGVFLVLLFLIVIFGSLCNQSFHNETVAFSKSTQPENEHQLAAGEAWLAGWQYREKISIYPASGAGTNFQFSITIYHDTDDGPDHSGYPVTVCTEGHAQTDFDDIRFTSEDGDTVLPCWRESYSASTQALFWFKYDLDVSSTTHYVYVYYGNVGASYVNGGTEVFILFDGFNGASLDTTLWTNPVGTAVVSGGYLQLGGTNAERVESMQIFDTGKYRLRSHANLNYGTSTYDGRLGLKSNTTVAGAGTESAVFWVYDATHTHTLTGDDTTYEYTDVGNKDGAYYTFEIRLDNTTACYYFIDDVQVDVDSTYLPTTNLEIILSDWRSTGTTYINWVALMKWQFTSPYLYVLSAEETATASFSGFSLDNPDDTDNMYARAREYIITGTYSHDAGYEAFDWVQINFYNSSGYDFWEIRYDLDTTTFSEEFGAPYIELVTGDCVASGSGTDLDTTWKFYIEWASDEYTNAYFKAESRDDWNDAQVSSAFASGTDVETRLDLSSFSLNDGSGTADRGNYDSIDSITASGTVIYYGGTVNPPSDEVDVWVNCSDVAGSPWSDLTLSSGDFSMTIDSDDAVGLDTYYFRVVEEGAGGSATNLLHAEHSDTYIADRIIVSAISTTDTRININANADIHVALEYEFDSTEVTTGSFTVDRDGSPISLTHISGTIWSVTESSASAVLRYYDNVTGSDTTHGISNINQNGNNESVIWDSLTVTITGPTDNRINIGENATGIVVIVVYDYDGTPFDGSFPLNDTTFDYGTVGKRGYTVSSASGDSYGITTISSNDETYCIWDSLTVSITDPADQRININDNCTGIVVTAIYDYDGTSFDGTLTLNDTTYDHGSVGKYWYTVTSASGDSYGVTTISSNDVTWCIFDSLTITVTGPVDNTIDLGETAVGIFYFAHYDYDGTLYDGSLHLNNTVYQYFTAGKRGYTVEYANGDDTYGISAISTNDETFCIWGSVTITITINIQWTVIGYNVTLSATGVYSWNNSAFSGTITLNTSTGILYPVYSTTGTRAFTVISIVDPLYGLTVFDSNTVSCTWDNIVPTTAVTKYWLQYTETAVYLVWGQATFWKWSVNGTFISNEYSFYAFSNGTTPTSAGGVYGSGSFGGLSIGPFNPIWHYLDLTINCSITINGQAYNWIIWEDIISVDILHSIHITDSGMQVSDAWITFWVHSNLNNGTFTIWDNMTGSFVEVGYSSQEGWYQVAKPTAVGTHWYWILVNATHSGSTSSGQTGDPSLTSDWWTWLNYKFTVNPVELSVDVKSILQNNVTCLVAFQVYTPTLTLSWNVTEASAGLVGSGTFTLLASGSYASVWWTKSAINSTDSWNLTITAGSSSLIIPGVNVIVDSQTYEITTGGNTNINHNNNTYSNNTYYENPAGFYVTEELAATIAVTGIGIFFMAVLFVDRLLKRERLKSESGGQK